MSLMVYDDLPYFTAGIYTQKSEVLVGGHSLRGIGWGHDTDGSLYWIVHNSWGEGWGEKGVGKIKAGQAGIDVWALSCNPDMIVD
jgi:C1A family cysteine protease